MSRFIVRDLFLAGLKSVERKRLEDSRGFFSRLFDAEDLVSAGWRMPIAQINHSFTFRCGTVRGLHFQLPPYGEMKLVSCVQGKVWDVALDLRTGSPTFLQWHAEELSAENNRALLIPEGFAHGFQTLSDDTELLYCHSAAYHAEAESGLNPRDPKLAIAWPLAIGEMSQKDEFRPMVDQTFKGIDV